MSNDHTEALAALRARIEKGTSAVSDTTPPPCGWLADVRHYADPPPAVARVHMGWQTGPRLTHTGKIVPLCAPCLEARRAEVTELPGGRFAVTVTYPTI